MTLLTEGEIRIEEHTAVEAPAVAPTFFLHTLRVQNFRAIADATFTFQPGLNVIIGPNNAAKTAVIDALRLVFTQGSYEKRDDPIRLRHTDVPRTDSPSTNVTVTFEATFLGCSGELRAQFYELCCPGDQHTVDIGGVEYTTFQLLYQAEFELVPASGRYQHVRSDLRGGPTWTNPVPREVLDGLRAVYLAPLRDLVNDRARVGLEIERLIISHTPDGQADELAGIPEQLRQQAAAMIGKVTDSAHQDAASRSLASYAKPYGVGNHSLSFMPEGVSDNLLRAMLPIFTHATHHRDGLPLSSNGLGINQLIYASIVLSRRGSASADRHVHRFFLIEEPEAHLHPQLQDSFFHALNQIADHQIFVTSHSPTITAKTDIDKIIVMRFAAATGAVQPLHLADAFAGKEQDKRYVHKFLDVTRSQLLFANGALFVEGITEALLMQRFSELIGLNLRDHGVEVIVIDSNEGFEHFRPLFAGERGPYSRGVFVTDGDEDPADVKSDEEFRGDTDFSLDAGLTTTGATATAVGYGTFEFGLLRSAIAGGINSSMLGLLHDAMKASAPQQVRSAGSQDQFARDFLDPDRPALAYQKMKERKQNVNVPNEDWYASWRTNSYFRKAKSDFAFFLYEGLAALPDPILAGSFQVPRYIQDAIRFVTHNDGHTGS
jgi:putative ATP-dependent endonuclease of the OLD family